MAEEETKKGLPLDLVKEIVNQSPFYRHMKMELIEFTEGRVRTRLTVEAEHMNAMGIAHGGAVASLADSTCGLAITPTLSEGEWAVTQSLQVHYLAPARPGPLRGEGWIVHRGKGSAVLECDIFDESGKKVAHANTVHVIHKRN